MDTRVFWYLSDSITAAATVAELDAMRELVARATLDRLEAFTVRLRIGRGPDETPSERHRSRCSSRASASTQRDAYDRTR